MPSFVPEEDMIFGLQVAMSVMAVLVVGLVLAKNRIPALAKRLESAQNVSAWCIVAGFLLLPVPVVYYGTEPCAEVLVDEVATRHGSSVEMLRETEPEVLEMALTRTEDGIETAITLFCLCLAIYLGLMNFTPLSQPLGWMERRQRLMVFLFLAGLYVAFLVLFRWFWFLLFDHYSTGGSEYFGPKPRSAFEYFYRFI